MKGHETEHKKNGKKKIEGPSTKKKSLRTSRKKTVRKKNLRTGGSITPKPGSKKTRLFSKRNERNGKGAAT